MNKIFVFALLLGFVLPGPAVGVEPVAAWEATLSLPTYAWYDDPNPVFSELEGSIYYPYTRQDLIEKAKTPRVYRAAFLENEFLRVTCLPELGGRIHSVLDKTTGEEMFHTNQEIKPARIAMRGAWISGGIEWNTGPHGHTATIVSPVDVAVQKNADGSASLVIGTTEKMFRTRWNVRVTLHPGTAYLDERIRMYNPTDGTHPYYFWNCTAFPNLEGTRFIYPMTLGTDHNGTSFFGWPLNDGKEMTWLRNYETMTSVFGYECIFDFFGAYNTDLDRGIVSYANHHVLPGKKAWTWGKDDFGVVSQMALSDAGPVHAQYIEVQSGPLLTQSDYGMLGPHEEVTWREFWYPVHGLGEGFEFATRDAAVQTVRDGGTLRVGIHATAVHAGASCRLSHAGALLLKQELNLTPKDVAWLELPQAPSEVDIEVTAPDGRTLLSYATPLAVPAVEEPDLTKKPARGDGVATADELYAKAYLADSRSAPGDARGKYLGVLEADPLHVPALRGLATLALEEGRFEEAEQYARKALERDAGHGLCWYLLGVAELAQGRLDEAVTCGYQAAGSASTRPQGLDLAGRAYMRQGAFDQAVEAFAQAHALAPLDTRCRNHWLAAKYAADAIDDTCRAVAEEAVRADPVDYTAKALAALCGQEALEVSIEAFRNDCGEAEFTATEVALFFADLGMRATACELVLELYPDAAKRPAMVDYYLAHFFALDDDTEQAGQHLDLAAAKPATCVMPSRVEAVAALRDAVARRPEDGHAHLFLGHVLAGLRRLDEALPHWQRAAELEPSLGVAQRLLGLHAWKKEKELEEAEAFYRAALRAEPGEQVLYRDLALILEQQKQLGEAIALIEGMPEFDTPRSDITLWRAEAYLGEERYDDCLALLDRARFSNREGGTRPHQMFVKALLARGQQRYEAGTYADAAADFRRALTYPENLEVGAQYVATDANVRYWLGTALLAMGEKAAARTEFETGAAQRTSDKPAVHVSLSKAHDEAVARCKTALSVLDAESSGRAEGDG